MEVKKAEMRERSEENEEAPSFSVVFFFIFPFFCSQHFLSP